MSEKLKTASVLAFEKKLVNSDALMYAGNWDDRGSLADWKPLAIQEKAIRGTISNRLKNAIADDPVKLDAEVQKANLQTVDVSALPFDCDTLRVCFTLRVLGDLSIPSVCNNPAYEKALSEKIQNYVKTHQFKELSIRYAENLANGRFLWRNRVGAEAVEVRVTHHQAKDKIQWIFDAANFSLRNFSDRKSTDLLALANVIQQGLSGNEFVLLSIEAFVKLGKGQEVFPSQELVLDQSSSKGNKSKHLYRVNDVAALHSQKIGNALRTIDSWYGLAHEVGPISVEPYGSVTSRGVAYRQPREKQDFYTLLDAWVLKDKVPEVEQQHYVIACLIRGGVFGEAEKK